MVEFDLWKESFIFACIYGVIVVIPCIIVAIIGKGLIEELGRYPSKTPVIQMSVLWKLIITEIITFTLLVMFFHIFHK